MDFTVAGEATRAIAYPAGSAPLGRTLVLAPGAGTAQTHPSLAGLAERLATRGVDVLTFDFAYRAAGRRLPDRNDKLEAAWRAAMALSRERFGARPLVIGGRSMGGRIASQVAAVDAVDGVVLIGYPLHPPKQPDKLRIAHLPHVRAPLLCLQGTRDEFGRPDEVRPYLPPHAELVAVTGGHSFTVDDAVLARIVAFVAAAGGNQKEDPHDGP